jgi:hypothetical protein
MTIDATKIACSLVLALAALVLLVTLVVLFPTTNPEKAIGATATRPGASTHIATQPRRPTKQLGPQPESALSAFEFAQMLIEATTRYASTHDDPTRISHADCVQAAPRRYMCSYRVNKPDAPRTCHLMQARWTPQKASSITVTLAGRTNRCGTLSEALQSLP